MWARRMMSVYSNNLNIDYNNLYYNFRILNIHLISWLMSVYTCNIINFNAINAHL